MLIVVIAVDIAFASQTTHFPPASVSCPVTSEQSFALAIPSIRENGVKWPQSWPTSIHDTPVLKSEGESPTVK